MKTILLFLLAMMIAFGASAQTPDTFGLWSMDGTEYVDYQYVTQYTPRTVFIVLHQPSVSAISGYEVGIVNMPDPLVSQTDLLGGENSGGDFNYVVTYPSPLATSEFTVLTSIILIFMQEVGRNWPIYMAPASPSSLPDHDGPVIIDGDGAPIPCGYVTGQPWVFTFNPITFVDSHDQTWSAVKDLFR